MLIHGPRDLGLAIRERRRALGLTQAELARNLPISRRWLIQVERGKANVSFLHLRFTMRALGMHLHVTVDGEKPPEFGKPLDAPDLEAILERHRFRGPKPPVD